MRCIWTSSGGVLARDRRQKGGTDNRSTFAPFDCGLLSPAYREGVVGPDDTLHLKFREAVSGKRPADAPVRAAAGVAA